MNMLTLTKKSYQITNSRMKLETVLEYNSKIEWIIIANPSPIKGTD